MMMTTLHPHGHGHPKSRGHQQQTVSRGILSARQAQIIYAILIAYTVMGSHVLKPPRLHHCSFDYRHSFALHKTLPSATRCLPIEQPTAIVAKMLSAEKRVTELPAEYLCSHVRTCAPFSHQCSEWCRWCGHCAHPGVFACFVLSVRLVHWRLWPLVALGPASRAWLGLCLLDIEIDESLRPDCPAHMCRSAGMLSRALWLFASVASLPVLTYL